MPFGRTFNSMDTHLGALKTIDDLAVKEWLMKARNSETEFAPKPEDDSSERNRKESLQRWYSDARYNLEKKYFTRDQSVLRDLNKFEEFVQKGLKGDLPLHFDSAAISPEYKNLTVLCG